jgi:hypothetical protein
MQDEASGELYRPVSIIALIARPEAYTGCLVLTSGFLGPDAGAIYLSADSARDEVVWDGVLLMDFDSPISDALSLVGKRVVLRARVGPVVNNYAASFTGIRRLHLYRTAKE